MKLKLFLQFLVTASSLAYGDCRLDSPIDIRTNDPRLSHSERVATWREKKLEHLPAFLTLENARFTSEQNEPYLTDSMMVDIFEIDTHRPSGNVGARMYIVGKGMGLGFSHITNEHLSGSVRQENDRYVYSTTAEPGNKFSHTVKAVIENQRVVSLELDYLMADNKTRNKICLKAARVKYFMGEPDLTEL